MPPLVRRGPSFSKDLYGHSTPDASLAQLLRQPPLQINCRQLMMALQALEERGGDKTLLQRGLAKYEYAERSQHTRKLQELSSKVRELIAAPLLELDVEQLRKALASLASVASDDVGALVRRGEMALHASETAQAEMRAARIRDAVEAIERCTRVAPLLLEAAALEAAVAEGEEMRVGVATLAAAREALATVARRDRASSSLAYIERIGADGITRSDHSEGVIVPFHRDVINGASSILEAIEEGIEAGVAMTVVQGAHSVLREVEQASAPLNAASSLLASLVAPSHLEMDVVAAESALAAAEAVGVPSTVTVPAAAALAAAREAQAKRDSVGAQLVLAAAGTSIDVAALRKLLGEATAAGVANRLLTAADAKLDMQAAFAKLEPSQNRRTGAERAHGEAGGGRAAASKAVAHVVAAAAAAAAARCDAAVLTVAKAQAKLEGARGMMASLRDAAQVTLHAAQASVAAAVEADAKVLAAPRPSTLPPAVSPLARVLGRARAKMLQHEEPSSLPAVGMPMARTPSDMSICESVGSRDEDVQTAEVRISMARTPSDMSICSRDEEADSAEVEVRARRLCRPVAPRERGGH